MFWVVWIVFAILVAVFADSRGRSWAGYMLLSLVFSPLLGFIILLVIPDLNKVKAQEDLTQRQEESRRAEVAREHEKQIVALQAIAGTRAQPAAASAGSSVADEIAKLGQLLEKGLLTEEEFKAQKSAVLKSG